MKAKFGPNHIKMAIEHNYLYRRYDEALRLALEFIACVEATQKPGDEKSLNLKEMFEISARSAMKCGRVDIATACADKLPPNDPGALYAKGLVYSFGGRFSDAIHCYVLYNQRRRLDYNVWKQMGITFMSADKNRHATLESANSVICVDFSHLCLARALAIMTTAWPSYDYAQWRFLREREAVERLVSTAKAENGDVERALSLVGEGGSEKLGGFERDDLEWIMKAWRRSRDLPPTEEGAGSRDL